MAHNKWKVESDEFGQMIVGTKLRARSSKAWWEGKAFIVRPRWALRTATTQFLKMLRATMFWNKREV
jgi:hypothetical protein